MKRRVNKVCLFSTEELDEFRAALYNVNCWSLDAGLATSRSARRAAITASARSWSWSDCIKTS